MQLPVLRALALTGVGNAALGGRDVSGFWPDASIFQFTKACDFVIPHDDGAESVASPNPLAWFDALKPWCAGLRLHVALRPLQPGQMPLPEHITVGFVGGGPRWLIEAVGAGRSQVWEGFDRLLDRRAPDRKIWASRYLLRGETKPQALSAQPLALAREELDDVLAPIEALARDLGAEVFAECFARARAVLGGEGQASRDDFLNYAEFNAEACALLAAVQHAWVFGGMGSWNDIGSSDAALKARYDNLSATLFAALEGAVVAIANSSFHERALG